jgi:hypothetical protein
MRATMQGWLLVRAAALSATTAVSPRRIVPSGHLPAALRDEHIRRDGRSAATRLSTLVLDRHRLGHGHGHDTLPATMPLRGGRQRLQHVPAALPTGRRTE